MYVCSILMELMELTGDMQNIFVSFFLRSVIFFLQKKTMSAMTQLKMLIKNIEMKLMMCPHCSRYVCSNVAPTRNKLRSCGSAKQFYGTIF